MSLLDHRPFALLLVGFVALAAIGCGEEPPPAPPPKIDFGLEISASDTDDQPIARVPVMLDGKVVGYTDKEGVFRGTISERPGTELSLGVGDLDGYRWLTENTQITETLRQNSSGIGIPMSLQVQAESRRREYLVWVKVACDDLDESYCQDRPVMLGDKEVGKTDEFGYAHFAFEDVPQEKITITIDTPDTDPETDKVVIDPADPKYEVTLGLESHVYLIEETFSNTFEGKKKTRRSPRKTTKRRPAKRTPKATPKKKKKKGEEVIDLW